MALIAKVLLPVPLSKLFDYRVDDGELIAIGQRVWVEFGQSRQLVGVVIALVTYDSDAASDKLKPILNVVDDFAVMNDEWLELIRFAARYYAESLGKVLKNALPKHLKKTDQLVIPQAHCLTLTSAGQLAVANDYLPRNASKQRALLQCIDEQQLIDLSTLRQRGFSKAEIDKLRHKGLIADHYQSPYLETRVINRPNYPLNSEQQQIIDSISQGLDHSDAHLIYGVTGSGKTEVYMRLIEQVVTGGQQVLLLVPEIGLTPQMLSRFRERFGRRVSVYHSGQSDSRRRDLFLSALIGDLPIVIGTRSAIFLPFKQLGLILVDEEHDLSYKQQDGFLYHARDLALYRAKQLGINVVLGSATPSLESIDNVNKNKIKLHRLRHRATVSTMPHITLVDRRGQRRQQVLADSVQQQMRRVLQTGKQVLLFLNKRGFAPVMRCDDCDWCSDCPQCSVYQVAHLFSRQLRCHHCGHQQTLPTVCPDCGGQQLYFLGAGTEKLELQLQQQFPNHRILRLDRDKQTTAKQLDSALEQIHKGDVDIILGTQLVVKGHHFPKVDMVCVVDADSALFSSDFRAEERLYQQLVQVAGRAGRESNVGQVLIQSTMPQHPIFHALIVGDYWQYAIHLLTERSRYQLAPATAMTMIKASAKQQYSVMDYLRDVKSALDEHGNLLGVLGPAPLSIERKHNRYYAQLWLSATDKTTLQKQLGLLTRVIKHYDPINRFKTIIDVDSM